MIVRDRISRQPKVMQEGNKVFRRGNNKARIQLASA
jgi:hypothetical protein